MHPPASLGLDDCSLTPLSHPPEAHIDFCLGIQTPALPPISHTLLRPLAALIFFIVLTETSVLEPLTPAYPNMHKTQLKAGPSSRLPREAEEGDYEERSYGGSYLASLSDYLKAQAPQNSIKLRIQGIKNKNIGLPSSPTPIKKSKENSSREEELFKQNILDKSIGNEERSQASLQQLDIQQLTSLRFLPQMAKGSSRTKEHLNPIFLFFILKDWRASAGLEPASERDLISTKGNYAEDLTSIKGNYSELTPSQTQKHSAFVEITWQLKLAAMTSEAGLKRPLWERRSEQRLLMPILNGKDT
ncbi:hypothetical protein E5288_WYG015965 [Bos mutus]|uniref:Uncharacterized protein n=1 Tax=Bos mutus TaxID=72004 RepID=A0A6B0S198_9CETA|nr:hypothetical protein [Bos mutus]